MLRVWNDFWFKPVDTRQYAALRITFGGLSAVYFIQLWPYIATQFSGSGWLGNIRQIAEQNGGSWSLLFLQAGEQAMTLAYSVIIIGILSAFLLMLGWQSRIAAGITWLVWVSLWNRNPLLMDGDDAVLKIMCFYLLLSPCGNCWSVDAYRHKMPQQAAVWPLRLMQFQIALIYFVSGWVKFYSPEWQEGTVMQYVLVHPHYSRWDAWAVIDQPMTQAILAGLAWFIRWWEELFSVFLLNAYTRKYSLIIGVLFHLGLLLTMNLRWFVLIMLALYLALIPNTWFKKFEGIFLKNYS